MSHRLFLTAFFLVSVLVGSVSAEPVLDAPESLPAGSQVEVSFGDSPSEKDFVTIVPPDKPEGQYDHYQYTKKRSSVELLVPEEAGKYEIRLLSSERGYPTLAMRELEVTPVEATVTGPTEVGAGAEFEISWTGPNNKKDFVTVVEKDAPERSYKTYKYTKRSTKEKQLSFRAPELPGEYEVRYLTGKKYYTLASHPFTVTSVSASIVAPKQVVAGANFEVDWTGPDNRKDFVTIVPANEKEGKYGTYKYTSKKYGPRKLNKLEFRAPEEPGEYEVRYLTGKKYLTLASAPFTVTGTSASLEAKDEVMEGAHFEVDWTGPDNDRDYLTIVPVGEKEGKTGNSYGYVSKKQGPRKLPKVSLVAPEESGDYEIRYVSGRKRFTLASRPIKIVPPTASLDAPAEAIVQDVINVTWEGPGNRGDYVALVKPDSENDGVKHYAYVRRGKTLRIKTPKDAGSYEVRYVTAQKKKVLARKSISILPSKVPGELEVVADKSVQTKVSSNNTSVALILDASGSMLKQDQGSRRIEIAKKAIDQLLKGPLEEGTPFSMRVFGHKEADSCRTDLEIPLSPLNRNAASKKVGAISAMNYAKTPIARSLELIQEDMESVEGHRVVILVTDGEETCDGDPEAAIKQLMASGFETRINIVGFAIDEHMLKESFQKWARLGNGKYFDASNAEELEKSIIEAVEVPYEVINKDEKVVASGVINGEAISVLPGTYRVRVMSSPEKSIESVIVEPERRRTVSFQG